MLAFIISVLPSSNRGKQFMPYAEMMTARAPISSEKSFE